MSETNPTPSTPPKRRRRFRWYTRLALVFVFLLIAIVVIAQLLFWSDLPRAIVQQQIGSILHVDAKLGSLKIGWLGNVAVRDLTLRLPTEEKPFLDVKRADLKLAPLPFIAFDQELRDLAVDGVDVQLRQQPNGRWNLQQLIASAAGPSPEPQQPTNPANVLNGLPGVTLANARVTVTQNDGKQLVLPDVSARLDASNALSKTFAASVGSDVQIDGKIAVLGSAPHEAHIALHQPPAGLGAFLGAELPSPIRAKLNWTGRLTRDGVVGILSIDDVAASVMSVAGRVDVNANTDGSLLVRPVGLTLRAMPDATTQPAASPAEPIVLVINAGAIRVDDRVRVEQLRGSVNDGGKFALDGLIDPTTFAGDLSAAWENVARAGIATTGHFDLRTKRLFTGHLRFDAGAGVTVRLPDGEAVGTLVVDGEAATLDAFDANLTIEPLTWKPTGKPAVVGPALVGNVVGKGTSISLTSLSNTDSDIGTLLARANVDRSSWHWWATLDTQQLKLAPLESLGLTWPIDANVAAYGDKDVYVVQHLYGRLGGASAWATGAYRRTDPKPLRLDTWAWLERPEAGDARMAGLTAQGVIGGVLDSAIDGPRNIEAALDVHADDLVVEGRMVGDVSIRIDASVTDDRAQVASREMEMLGGSFALHGYRDLTATNSPFVASLDFKKIPVDRLGKLVNQGGLSGTIDTGHVELIVPASLNVDDVTMTATAQGTKLAADSLTAETLTISAAYKDGELRAVPILREGEGSLDAELVVDRKLERPITLAFNLVNWPAPANVATTQAATEVESAAEPAATRPFVRSKASAKGDASVTLGAGNKIDATLTMNAGVDRGDERLAAVSIEAAATDKVVTLKKALVNTLDGTLTAAGEVDVTNVNGARLDASFERLAPNTLGWLDPLLAEVRGRYDGSFTIAPAKGPRPLGPMEITLAVRPTPDAGFRSVALGNVDARGYADFESAKKYRFVTDRAEIHVADGTVKPFGRFSYDAAVGPSQLVTVRFDRLDVDQLTRVAKDDGKPLSGRLAGTLRIYGPARTLDTVSGEAVVKITESDLANFGPIAALYNVMNIGAAGNQPTGTGDVSARIESGTLTLLDATYFNRGVFANAFGSVPDVVRIPDSPVDLKIIGSLQPLRQSGNSFFSQVVGTASDTLAALQTSVSAIEVKGTLKNPSIRQIGLSELGSSITSVLIGKTK